MAEELVAPSPRRRIKPARARKAAVAVARSIVDEITDRRYTPGTKLQTERDMVAEFDIGRGTLRESLRFLELTGIIVMRAGPGGGPIVAAPDAQDFASLLGLYLQLNPTPFGAIIEARKVLEPTIASMAATNASPADLDDIAASINGMGRFLEDEENFALENDRFHAAVAKAAGNSLFALLIGSLHLITDGMPLGVDYPLPRRSAVLTAHQSILQALQDGDAEAAYAAMLGHMEEFEQYVDKKFPSVSKRLLRWSDIAP